MVDLAAALLPVGDTERAENGPWTLSEGPRWEIEVSPGTVQVRTRDWAKVDRAAERAYERRRKGADAIAAWQESGEPKSGRVTIAGFSRKSRNRMCKRLHQLDYSPLFADPTRMPAMVTLTYPGDWLIVAPTGRAVKRHLDKFRKRYIRAWGEDLPAVWKLEFQRRGAPHFHLLMVPPHGQTKAGEPFRQWLSRVWAEIVDHPDPVERMKHERAGTGIDYAEGLRAQDPRRLAVYFSKHGLQASKEYQHDVPEAWRQLGSGPGRFWGYWGLAPVTAAAHVNPEVGIAAGRVLRRFSRSKQMFQTRSVQRIDRKTGRIYYRKSRFRVARLANGRGWLSVNDGPAFASQMSRYLSTVAAGVARP
jgi:hypothetical protein